MTEPDVCASAGCFPPSRSTGKERDTESGNDYFGARYYSSAMGRFMSPDWSAKIEPVPYARLGDPQSLNLYAYVRNNPLTGVDIDGHVENAYFVSASAGSDPSADAWQWNAQWAANKAAAAAQQPNAAPVTYSPNQSFSINLGGGNAVSGNFGTFDTTGSIYPAEKGVNINADSNCSGCQWVQIVTRTGADAHGPAVDAAAGSGTPFYPYQDHGKSGSFADQPGNYMRGDWSAGAGSFSAVAVLGVPNSSNHSFKPLGAISYGFSVDAHGKLTSRAPVSAPGSIRGAMNAMHAAMPSWTGN